MGEREEPVKGSRTVFTMAISIGLIAGSAAAVAAQDEEAEAPPAAYATGTIGWPPAELVEPDVELVPDGNEERGLMLIDLPVEFTDPRLSGMLTVSANGTTREFPDGRAWIESRTYRIVNDGGAWNGSGRLVRGFSEALGDQLFDEETMLLTGDGAYDGYIAFISVDALDDQAPVEALILAAEQPPLPEPVAVE